MYYPQNYKAYKVIKQDFILHVSKVLSVGIFQVIGFDLFVFVCVCCVVLVLLIVMSLF